MGDFFKFGSSRTGSEFDRKAQNLPLTDDQVSRVAASGDIAKMAALVNAYGSPQSRR